MRIESVNVNDMQAKSGDIKAGTDNAGDFMAMLLGVLVPDQNNKAGPIFQPGIKMLSGEGVGNQEVSSDNATAALSCLMQNITVPILTSQVGPEADGKLPDGVLNVPADLDLLSCTNLLPVHGTDAETGMPYTQPNMSIIANILPGSGPAANTDLPNIRPNASTNLTEGATGEPVAGQQEAGAIIGQTVAETGSELLKAITTQRQYPTGVAAELTAGSPIKESTNKVNSGDTSMNLPLGNKDQPQVEVGAIRNPNAGQEPGSGQMSQQKPFQLNNQQPGAKVFNEQMALAQYHSNELEAGIKVETSSQDAAVVNDITLNDAKSNEITSKETTPKEIASNDVSPVKQTAFAQLKPEVIDLGSTQVKQAPQIVLRTVTQLVNQLDNKDANAATTIRLKLEPKQLGEMTVRLSYTRGELTAHFYTASVMARDAVEGTLPQLKELLSQHNIQLNDVAAFVGQEDSRHSGQERYRHQGNTNPYFTNNGDDGPFPEIMPQDTASINENLNRLV